MGQAQLSCVAQDDDPYVRKTAAMCVAKLHDINAELVEDRGFLDTLKVSPSSPLYSALAVPLEGLHSNPDMPWLHNSQHDSNMPA